MSVAWLTEIGPSVENQDRAAVHIGSDGSWLVAVADGMGGQPEGREAAIAAIRGLPRRTSGPEELHDGFAAAWTPDDGLLVGYAGDTLPVLWHNDGDRHGRTLGTPHRRPDGTIALFVGAPGVWPEKRDGDYGRMDILTEAEIARPRSRRVGPDRNGCRCLHVGTAAIPIRWRPR